MNETFRPSRKHLFVGTAGAVFFAANAAFWMLIEPPHPSQSYIWGLLAIEVFWLSWLATAPYGLAAYWREELRIDGARVRFCGVFKTVTFDLAAVTLARWRRGPHGSLILRAGAERLKIHFHYDDSKRLMECLHAQIPYQVQVDWPLFHHHHLRPRVIGPDHVLVDRKRFDRYLIPASIAIFVALLTCGIWVDFPKAVASGGIVALVLLVLRYSIPKKGFHDRNMRATLRSTQRDEPEALWLMGWLLLALVVMIVLAVAERWLHLALPFWLQMTGVAILGIGFVTILGWGTRRGYIREQKRKADLEAEWNSEHPSV